MNIIKNKKGIGLPTILAIVVFIMGTAASLLSITFSQTNLVETNIENTESYQNAVYNVDAAVRVMIRELINDNEYLTVAANIDNLEEYFSVEITPHETVTSLWRVTSNVTTTRSVTSYISTRAGTGGSVSDTTNLLAFFSEFISGDSKSLPEEVLNQILPSYFETFEVDQLSAPKKNDLESIKKIVQYITDKTTFISISSQLLNLDNQVLDGNFYRDGSLTINSGNTLELAEGRILFVNGDLIMKANSNLIGNVVVFGSVIFEGSSSTQSTFLGTLYIGNHFTSNTKLIAGHSDRPSFIFSTLHNNINQKIEGYVFITGSKFTYDVNGVTSTIHGGVYVDDNDFTVRRGILNIIPTDITLFYDLFETYAMPFDSSLVSDGSYTYTSPR